MTDPLSLTETKRLAGTADTILLRATRTADLETPIGAFLRLDDGVTPAYLLESVEGGERLGRYSFLGIGPRRLLEVRGGQGPRHDPPGRRRGVRPRPAGHGQRRRRSRSRPSARSSRSGASCPVDGMPRFTGGAVGALSYDAISSFEPSVPLPDRDPVNAPLASFIETDLVIVFDHLSHQLSAIASLHTEAPDLDGRYRIAERAIFEALERTARPSQAEMTAAFGRSTADDGAARRVAPRRGRDEPRARRVHPRGRARQGRDRGRRGDPGRPRPAPELRPAGVRGRHADRRDRPVPRAAPGQPQPVPVLHPHAGDGGRRRQPGAPRPGRRATGCRPTRSPAPARAARRRPTTTGSPTSCATTPRSVPST